MMVVRTTAVLVQKRCERIYSVLAGTSNGKPRARQVLRLVATYAISFVSLIGGDNLRRNKAFDCLGLVFCRRVCSGEQ